MVDPDLEVGGVCHHERLLALKGPIARRPDGAVQLGAGLKEGLKEGLLGERPFADLLYDPAHLHCKDARDDHLGHEGLKRGIALP